MNEEFPIDGDFRIKTVKLAGDIKENMTCVVSGWGVQDYVNKFQEL